MFKQAVKDIIGNRLSSFNYPILVNSYGRSGSTVLSKSIIENGIKAKNKTAREIAYRSTYQTAWDLSNTEFKNGIVYKTHDYPPNKKLKQNVKMLYTYADPVDVILSLIRIHDNTGEAWLKMHYNHLKVSFTNFKNLIYEDELQLEYHLDSWLQETRFPIAFIQYEKMWNHQEDISRFLGFKIELPTFKKRKAKRQGNLALEQKLKKTYKSLREKIGRLDSFFENDSKKNPK